MRMDVSCWEKIRKTQHLGFKALRGAIEKGAIVKGHNIFDLSKLFLAIFLFQKFRRNPLTLT